jgi:hypothetical protein
MAGTGIDVVAARQQTCASAAGVYPGGLPTHLFLGWGRKYPSAGTGPALLE